MPEIGHGSSGAAGRLAGGLNRYILSRRFERVVGVSQDIRQNFIEQLGFSSERTTVIHNGIELPDPQPRSRKGAAMVVGSAGRLFAVKDYLLMVRIARELAGSGDICFRLAGDGPERAALEHSIREYGLDQAFALKGNVDDMDSFYRELDIYLNTSLHEGIPMAILEAMARGLPVIAPKVGGITEIITDGVEGFLISSRDPRDFAIKCLEMSRNPDMREKMGRAAREKVLSHFSSVAMAGGYHRLYKDLACGLPEPLVAS